MREAERVGEELERKERWTKEMKSKGGIECPFHLKRLEKGGRVAGKIIWKGRRGGRYG